MLEWTIRHHVAGVDFAGVDNVAPYCRGGQCRNGLIGTVWHGYIDNAGDETCPDKHPTLEERDRANKINKCTSRERLSALISINIIQGGG